MCYPSPRLLSADLRGEKTKTSQTKAPNPSSSSIVQALSTQLEKTQLPLISLGLIQSAHLDGVIGRAHLSPRFSRNYRIDNNPTPRASTQGIPGPLTLFFSSAQRQKIEVDDDEEKRQKKGRSADTKCVERSEQGGGREVRGSRADAVEKVE